MVWHTCVCLATKSDPRNTQHDEKDATTLESVLAFSHHEQLQQIHTHNHTHTHTHIYFQWTLPLTSVFKVMLGVGGSSLLLRCCHYGYRLNEGCLNINIVTDFSTADLSVCCDTAAKSCWERERERGEVEGEGEREREEGAEGRAEMFQIPSAAKVIF